MLGSAGAGSPGCPLACEHRVLLYRLGIGSGAASSIIGGGGANIHIFVFTDHKDNRFQKKLIMQNTKI
jgi:hypothetical protein